MQYIGVEMWARLREPLRCQSWHCVMRKLQVHDNEIMQVALQQEIQRSEELRYDHRLHGVLLVSHGLSCHHVAEYLGEDPVTIQRWVHRFNRNGFGGLLDGERPGRPSRITPSQWSRLEQALRQSPRKYGYSQNLWDGKLLAHHLEKSCAIDLGVRQCQRIFRQMGFRRRKPRPLIAKADPEAQARYKKTPPPSSP
jgi:transposase